MPMHHLAIASLAAFVCFASCEANAPSKEPAPTPDATAAPDVTAGGAAAAGAAAAAGDTAPAEPIVPVHSWTQYREVLKARGKTDAEIDANLQKALASIRTMDRSAGDDRVGVAAPPFEFDAWLNTEPLSLEGLRGKVLLVRWWTETCPFCASSGPALRALHDDYADKGLTVIGVFHPKARRDDPLDLERVRSAVETRQFVFPIAVDWDWRNHTLKHWWLTGPERPATSVTFLVDKAGVIRFVHPGMEYHDPDGNDGHEACNQDMANIRATIERLLAE